MKITALINLLLLFSFAAAAAGAEPDGTKYVTRCKDKAASPGAAAPDKSVKQPTYSPEEIKTVEQRLVELFYNPGEVDGRIDLQFECALMGFQKMNGLERTGEINSKVLEALENPVYPSPAQKHQGIHTEADLERQVLTVYRDNEIVRIMPASSGGDKPFKEPGGGYGSARTPLGNFKFFARIWGLHVDHLGDLFNPVYFDEGGYAVHGDTRVPSYNASHGCIRIPIEDSVWFEKTVPLHTPLLVSATALPTTRRE